MIWVKPLQLENKILEIARGFLGRLPAGFHLGGLGVFFSFAPGVRQSMPRPGQRILTSPLSVGTRRGLRHQVRRTGFGIGVVPKPNYLRDAPVSLVCRGIRST